MKAFTVLAASAALLTSSASGAAAERAMAGQCRAGEQLIFSCGHGGKVVSICVSPQTTAYRYGRPGATDFEIVSNGHDGRAYKSVATTGLRASPEATNLRFRNGPFSYIVTEGQTAAHYGSEAVRPGHRYGVLTIMNGARKIGHSSCRITTKPWGLEQANLPDDPEQGFVTWY